MDEELHVVTIAEFRERSEELTREVNETGEAIFIMDGDTMLARLLPPELTLEQIRQSLALIGQTDTWADEDEPISITTDAVEMVNEQRR